ncbi:hypothetical protein GCM10010123_09280 [Pilimelia anulata]|uniref:2'-5' RNA ligase family protein n=1 Tax=Pilimelia anulata TaxID=53371 RepID=A0A8J3B029_9ACTN|nr:2'-5' RNA ligase family protein [Pilimelia anulata]GGJ81633.1 hypothetical protein GCM10010123_09280 [Pilimelia anulata]
MKTGLVIPVPEADPLLDRLRRQFPALVREIPAHVSLLYPFVPLDDATVVAVQRLVTGTPAFELTLGAPEVRGDLGYAPVDSPGLARLVGRVRERWPDVVPYGGRFGEVPPHLTLAMGAARLDAPELPLTVTAREAWLVAFTERWTVPARFPFAPPPAPTPHDLPR